MNYVCAFSSSNRTKLLFSAVFDLGFPAILTLKAKSKKCQKSDFFLAESHDLKYDKTKK